MTLPSDLLLTYMNRDFFSFCLSHTPTTGNANNTAISYALSRNLFTVISNMLQFLNDSQGTDSKDRRQSYIGLEEYMHVASIFVELYDHPPALRTIVLLDSYLTGIFIRLVGMVLVKLHYFAKVIKQDKGQAASEKIDSVVMNLTHRMIDYVQHKTCKPKYLTEVIQLVTSSDFGWDMLIAVHRHRSSSNEKGGNVLEVLVAKLVEFFSTICLSDFEGVTMPVLLRSMESIGKCILSRPKYTAAVTGANPIQRDVYSDKVYGQITFSIYAIIMKYTE
jgi:hypothetical protein